MSKYTTELRFICENLCGYTDSQGLSKVDEIISKSAPLIFDFDYPIFDDDYKIPLEKKIIKHYYLREIGFETVGIWKLKLNDKLNEIMPYFNQLYKSELLKFNPLIDVDVKTTSITAGKGNTDFTQADSKTTAETETKKDVFSSAEHSAFDSSKTGSASGESASEGTSNGTLTNSSTSSNSSTFSSSSTSSNTGSTSDTSTVTKKYSDKDDYSDTPQGSVGNLENLTYLTNARRKSGDSTDSTTSKGSSSGELTASEKTTTSGEGKASSTDTTKNTTKNTSTSKDTTSGTETSTNDKTFNSTDTVNSSRNGSASSDVSSNTATTNTQDYVENVLGKRNGQTYSAMLTEFRQTFLNIDKMILNELSDLFMTIY